MRLLDGDQARALAPYLSASVVAAAHCPAEGKADTRTAAPALARAALRLGALVQTRTAVTAMRRLATGWELTLTGSGADASNRTVRTDAVVIAAGVWTTELGELIDVSLPTIPLALTMTVTAKTAAFIPHLVQHAGARLSLKQSHDGTVLIGGGWPARLMRDAAGRPDFTGVPNCCGSPSAAMPAQRTGWPRPSGASR
nr:FAD-dependent oxidoreductase [Leifsonia xyli]